VVHAVRITPRLAGGALLLACLTAAAGAGAQPAARDLVLTGSVLDTLGAPIADAEVALLGTDVVRRTSGGGEFRFPALRAGRYLLRARRIGYVTRIVPVDGSAGDTLTLTLNLAPAAPVLQSVVVRERETTQHVGKLAGFYSRMESSAAPPSSFVTREEIERTNPRQTSDLVKVRGARATGCLTGKVYVDGVLSVSPAQVQAAQSMPLPTNLSTQGTRPMPRRPRPARIRPEEAVDFLPPDHIAAMEIYRGAAEAPAEFNATASPGMGSGCVILIWTR
jgi:hypothetical protein